MERVSSGTNTEIGKFFLKKPNTSILNVTEEALKTECRKNERQMDQGML